ncbi:MAG TPA: tetratricopeptide repeat protein, partial [Chloroflexi bacterium]|nr:tetratricopeptide repeat protein [Chloroflexota bacterium]
EFTGYLASQGVSVLQIKIAPGEPSPLGRIVSALQPLIRPAALAELPPATLGVLAPLFSSIGQMRENLLAPPRLDPAGERQRLYAALTDLTAACLPGEALLWIDDAHRMGRVACEMLTGMTGRLKLLLSYRSEEVPPDHPLRQVFRAAQREGAPAVLRLHALRPADVEALIRQLSHSDLAEIAAEINQQAEGNPLHVVSLLQHLFDEGQLYVDAGGGWGMTGEAAVPLPATIREAIQSRLQRLTPAQRRVLDMAAVLGGAFDFAVLQAASPQPEASLLTVLDELMDAALITEPRRLGQPEFAIAHDRYTEISYETLPGVRRRQLHAQAGRALEQVHAGDLQPHYPALATHFGKAEIPEKERRYAALAGEQAAARFANAEAIRYLERALELTAPEDVERRARLLLRCEQVYDLLGEREAQRDALGELTTLETRLSPQDRAEVLHRKARLAWLSDDTPQAQIHIEESIRLAQTCGAVEVEAAGYLLRGKMTLDQDSARQLLGKALLLAQQAGLRGMEGDIVRSLGNACFWQNDYEASQAYFEEALTIHREVGDLRGELSACNNLGLLRQTRGDFPQARDFFEQGLAICEKTGDRLAEGVLLTNLGEMTAALGEYRQAQTYLERACRIREEVGNEEGVAMVLQRLGDVLTRQGAYSPAMHHYARALEINTRIKQHRQRGETLAAMGMLRYELGDYAGAQEVYRQSLAVLPPEAEPHWALAMAGLSLLHHALGDDAAAIAAGEQALSLPVCESLPALRASVLTHLGHALSGAGHPAEAAGKYRQALEIRRRLQQPHLETEPLAGLAALARDGGHLDDAMALVKPVLAHLEAGPLQGPAHPTRVYLTCYRVLRAAGDPRAGEVLAAAHALLQERAAAIQDASLRRSYLENVAANREVVRLFEGE